MVYLMGPWRLKINVMDKGFPSSRMTFRGVQVPKKQAWINSSMARHMHIVSIVVHYRILEYGFSFFFMHHLNFSGLSVAVFKMVQCPHLP